MRECVTLGPNDQNCSPLSPATRFPLGCLCAAVVTEPASFYPLLQACALRPLWVPLVVVAPPELEASVQAYLTAVDLTRAGQSTVILSPALILPDPQSLRQHINHRPPPPAELMAQWLAIRLSRPDLRSLLTAALSTESPPAIPHRTLSSQLRKHLNCRPSDLVRLATQATLPRLAPTVNDLAFNAHTTATRLGQRVHRVLGFSLSDYNHRPGWEWVLEAACRCGLGRTGGEWGVGSGEWGVGHEGTAPEANVNATNRRPPPSNCSCSGRKAHLSSLHASIGSRDCHVGSASSQ